MKQKVLQLVVDRIVVEESRVVIQHVVPTGAVRLQTEQQPPKKGYSGNHTIGTCVDGVCSGYVYMPCMAYTRLSQVPDYANNWLQVLTITLTP